MAEEKYDVIVLGGGAGGVPAAVRASQLGGHVAMVECGDLGGLCMNRGCVPFGHMSAASGILGGLALGKEMGLGFREISKDYAALLKRQNELIAFMREGVKGTLNRRDVQIIKGRGRLAGKRMLDVDGKTVSYKNIILATGAKWVSPDFPGGAELDEVMNSDDLLEVEKPPGRVLLFGRSPWLIEIAQILHRFGSQVILATEEKDILPDESKTIRSRLANALKKQGIPIHTRAGIAALEKRGDTLHSVLRVKDKEETVMVDRVIHIKRKAALQGLGLNTVGLDEHSEFLKVNERMETDIKGIYAVGDLSAPETRHYSHLASAGGIVAAENAMGLDRTFDPRMVTRIVFTQPQAACVGMTRKEAKAADYDAIVGAAPLSMNPFGMILAQNEGIVEVVSERRYGEILGIHILGEGACEMAGQAVLAMQMEATLEELARLPYPHPTLSESLPEAAREALGWPIYLP